ncbi:MAG: hypothetical protein QMD46_12790 [Methanomicrobiales archaeon]|nr:hypothetical protein [Methanomicrobiales archaeon]
MRKWNIPLTYAPKIAGVLAGSIRQTIRTGRKFSPGDLVSFHGWEGKPYRSKWSFRTPYAPLKDVIPITIRADGVETPLGFRPWHLLDGIARLDGIEPPTGESLRDVLLGMHTVPADGIEAQILRW